MLSHLDEQNLPTMVAIQDKSPSQRSARAQGSITLSPSLLASFDNGELQSPKGPVISTATIAATMAVKKTSELIPFCHPIPIESCKIFIKKKDECTLQIECEVKTFAKTGVEMEALTGVSLACLTIYDMCKSTGYPMSIGDITLLQKTKLPAN